MQSSEILRTEVKFRFRVIINIPTIKSFFMEGVESDTTHFSRTGGETTSELDHFSVSQETFCFCSLCFKTYHLLTDGFLEVKVLLISEIGNIHNPVRWNNRKFIPSIRLFPFKST